jgi:hypothetical protein
MLSVVKLRQGIDGSMMLEGAMPKIIPGEEVSIFLYDNRLTGDLSTKEIFPLAQTKEALAKYFLEQGFVFFLSEALIQRGFERAKERGHLLLIARFSTA